jgi:hypothetical protein
MVRQSVQTLVSNLKINLSVAFVSMANIQAAKEPWQQKQSLNKAMVADALIEMMMTLCQKHQNWHAV